MKTLRQSILLAWCLLYTVFALVSCGPSLSPGIPRAVIVPARLAPVSVAPVVAVVAKVSRSVDLVEREAVSARDAMARARLAADEARGLADVKNTAMVAAIDQMLAQLDEAGKSQQALLHEVQTLKAERDTLGKETQALNTAVTGKEAEVSALRQSVSQANAVIADSGTVISRLNASNESLLKRSASAGVYRNWCLTLAGLILVAGLSYVALKSYHIIS